MKVSKFVVAWLAVFPVIAQVQPTAPVIPTPRAQPAPPVGPGSVNNPPIINPPPTAGRTFDRPIFGGPTPTTPVDPAAAVPTAPFPPTAEVTNLVAGRTITNRFRGPNRFRSAPMQITNLGIGIPLGVVGNTPLTGPNFPARSPVAIDLPPGATIITSTPALNQPVPIVPGQSPAEVGLGAPPTVQSEQRQAERVVPQSLPTTRPLQVPSPAPVPRR